MTQPARIDRPDLVLAPPPKGGAPGDPLPLVGHAFRIVNRWLMVPLTRAGLGAWMSSPVGGAMVLLRVRGRKSGLVRDTPLNYVVAEGGLWVLAGFGPRTEWYRNLLADGRVEAVLPGRTITGQATEVRDPAVRARIMPRILRSTIGPSIAAGLLPWRADAALLDELDFVPLVRIDADEGWLDAGPDDPGGHAWIWRQGLLGTVSVAGTLAAWRGLSAVVSVRKDMRPLCGSRAGQ